MPAMLGESWPLESNVAHVRKRPDPCPERIKPAKKKQTTKSCQRNGTKLYKLKEPVKNIIAG